MPKKKGGAQGKKITLKMAKNSMKITVDGKRRLDLSNMGIANFPKCILKLTDIEEIDLSRNLIKKIPDFINRFPKLRYLDFHTNKIERIPETICQLELLYYLDLSNNKLTTDGLPAELTQLKNLRVLNLGLNSVEMLPTTIGTLKELKELGLFDNRITYMPEKITKLPKLKHLNVLRNPFTTPQIDVEPIDTIDRIENLYLARRHMLCRPCLKKCQRERDKWSKVKNISDLEEEPDFTGLISPNSVAKQDEASWRVSN
ncbi:leucine-rich repeat-containing protein 18-like [Heptranchias perlo]|uniref:leucine-rich repeat-containing protein 18-like n=1 Tax=Heptranchias perlo TaxID=212740 RepID=UPI003559C86E